jgi:hypothetical protein
VIARRPVRLPQIVLKRAFFNFCLYHILQVESKVGIYSTRRPNP